MFEYCKAGKSWLNTFDRWNQLATEGERVTLAQKWSTAFSRRNSFRYKWIIKPSNPMLSLKCMETNFWIRLWSPKSWNQLHRISDLSPPSLIRSTDTYYEPIQHNEIEDGKMLTFDTFDDALLSNIKWIRSSFMIVNDLIWFTF